MTSRDPSAPKRGLEILLDPALNKGTAFSEDERDRLKLRGLVPPHVGTIEEQEVRALGNLRRKQSDIEKYIFLTGLQDRNETLFYRVLLDNIEELMPIVYTPTVGQACAEFAHIFRRSRGLYVTARDQRRVRDILRNWPHTEIGIIVITDGERILGLGDLGANGMGIPVGKLALYTALAGIHPSRCLPVMLDVGTENIELHDDPLYLGLRQHRERGASFDALVEEFVEAAQDVFPGALIQFEDFANRNAIPLLEQYRNRVLCFNDDIQGTASVSLAGLLAGLRITRRPLQEQTVLFYGAGSAAKGTADLIVSALVADGMPVEEARRHCWLMDSKGLVVAERTDLAEHKRPYAHHHEPITDLQRAVEELQPTALIGASGQPKRFTEGVVTSMAIANERPIIFALSNPTSKAECTAEECYQWSKGRAVFASGSPFPPVTYNGREFIPGQGNNAYIFPGVGLGAIACRARHLTDEMFYEAARTLAGMTSESSLAQGSLFPPLSSIRDVSRNVAATVCRVAADAGLASLPTRSDWTTVVEKLMYWPEYTTREETDPPQ